ncbi:MAG: alpha-L-fucosidase [Verrucomicrobiae bacterium]|nr:alpha-L-fucosidase [Verrucomicrobiae bacterium]
MNAPWYERARYGLFIHYGLYSQLARGEWVMNREQIPPAEYAALQNTFTAEKFDAEAIAEMAVRWGMRYVIFTTMHHEAFRLYDSALSDFNSVKSPAGRDLVAEMVAACRKRGLRIGLYHSLNNWTDQPDAVSALEDRAAYDRFIDNTFRRLEELVTRFNPVDVMWYDGWWPFNADQWQAERMNAMIRKIQPHILFNGRNGLPGDFGTPEGHVTAPVPWRPWEACMTLNRNWGFHAGDPDWKSPREVVDMLIKCAAQRGNLLLNIGPRGDGSIPGESVRILDTVGAWLAQCGEAVYDTDFFSYDLMSQEGKGGSEFSHHGAFTASGRHMYFFVRSWVPRELILCGVRSRVRAVSLLNTRQTLEFTQDAGGKVTVRGLPSEAPDAVCPVLKFEMEGTPGMYLCGGMRVPAVRHPHYDPCPSDIAH